MANISHIDKNFEVPTKVQRENLCFYDIEQEPFRIYGVKKENGKFRRLPEQVAASVTKAVYTLHTNTAGGRVRFITDSPYIAIHARISGIPRFPHAPHTGIVGLDLYAKDEEIDRYFGTFIPPLDIDGGFESVLDLPGRKERLITINFPLYSDLTKLYVGLEQGASIKRAPDYTYELPVVSYGSSITQGGCASRPGNCYQHILTREFDCDHINLGFSGWARAEVEMGDWIKQIPMKAFLYDYDNNAPTIEHLAASHERMFRQVREAQPNLPIVLMSRPKYYLNDDEKERREIIRTTYQNALAAGDRNVYFIDGTELMGEIKDNGTVDGTHPSDSGFVNMAKVIAPVLKEILEKK